MALTTAVVASLSLTQAPGPTVTEIAAFATSQIALGGAPALSVTDIGAMTATQHQAFTAAQTAVMTLG